MVHAAAAICLGHGDAEQAELGGFGYRLLGKAVLGVGPPSKRRDLAGGEVARQGSKLGVRGVDASRSGVSR
jgi:hypothetical protein